jgi:hypothetical protein
MRVQDSGQWQGIASGVTLSSLQNLVILLKVTDSENVLKVLIRIVIFAGFRSNLFK